LPHSCRNIRSRWTIASPEEGVHNARSIEGERQPMEIGANEFGALFE